MKDKIFIDECLEKYVFAIRQKNIVPKLIELKNILLETQAKNKKVIIAGNGGSAAIASHVSVDFTKQGGVRTINFNEADLITCFSNDYGYENCLAKCIEFYADNGDHLILISSSGRSKNIINAALEAKKKEMLITSFTGFNKDNDLSKFSDLFFWVDSRSYNIIENMHQIWLLIVCDMLVGKLEYSA